MEVSVGFLQQQRSVVSVVFLIFRLYTISQIHQFLQGRFQIWQLGRSIFYFLGSISTCLSFWEHMYTIWADESLDMSERLDVLTAFQGHIVIYVFIVVCIAYVPCWKVALWHRMTYSSQLAVQLVLIHVLHQGVCEGAWAVLGAIYSFPMLSVHAYWYMTSVVLLCNDL